MRDAAKNVVEIPAVTKKLVLVVLAAVCLGGCVWGEWNKTGARCEGDLLHEPEFIEDDPADGEGNEDPGDIIIDCREVYGVGCLEDEDGFTGCADENPRCAPTEMGNDLFRLEFCYSEDQVAICTSGLLSNIIECQTGEICFELGNNARCVIRE